MSENWLPLSSFPTEILEENLVLLREQCPDVAQSIEEANVEGIELMPFERGLNSMRHVNGGKIVTIQGAGPLDREIVAGLDRVKQAFEAGAWVVVLIGVGLGYVASEAVKFLKEKYPGHAKGIICIEENPSYLRAAFSVYGLRPVLSARRALWLTGPNAVDRIRRIVEQHDLGVLNADQIAFVPGRPLEDPDDAGRLMHLAEVFRETIESHRSVFAELRSRAARKYAQPSPGPIRSVWSHGSTDSVWGWITRDAVDGFRDIGIDSSMLVMNDYSFTRWFRAQAEFLRRCPDALFFLNHSSEFLAAFCREYRLPRFIWYVDDPANSVSVTHHPDDFVFCVSPTFRRSLDSLGGHFLGEVPIAASLHREEGEWRDECRCEVSYVGSVSDPSPVRTKVNAPFNEWLDKVVEKRMRDPFIASEQILSAYPPPIEGMRSFLDAVALLVRKARYMSEPQQIEYYLYIEANTRRRLQFIESLAGFDLVVYGPEDWLRLLPPDLHPCYRGIVPTERALACVYRSSTINLNINALQGFSFVNIRNFDVPVCGGFLLSEWVPCASSYFEPGKEMAFFEGIEDLAQKVRYYLDRPEERYERVEKARGRIQSEHTYGDRMRQMLDLFYNSQQSRGDGTK